MMALYQMEQIFSPLSAKILGMGYDKDRLLELCTLASTEQDPGMMLKLVREINLVLAANAKRAHLDLFPLAPGTGGAIIHAV